MPELFVGHLDIWINYPDMYQQAIPFIRNSLTHSVFEYWYRNVLEKVEKA